MMALDEKIRESEIVTAVRYPDLWSLFSNSGEVEILIPSENQLNICKANKWFSLDDQDTKLVKFQSIGTHTRILPSKQKPKLLTTRGTDGKFYYWLVKNERRGDLRKDMRLMEFGQYVNHLLKADPFCKKRNLQLKTFSVLPVSEVTGIIEWVSNVCTLRSLIHEELRRSVKDYDQIIAL
ncbi:hypothetical protein IE077_003445, partial [Cardiosporidium cionae]